MNKPQRAFWLLLLAAIAAHASDITLGDGDDSPNYGAAPSRPLRENLRSEPRHQAEPAGGPSELEPYSNGPEENGDVLSERERYLDKGEPILPYSASADVGVMFIKKIADHGWHIYPGTGPAGGDSGAEPAPRDEPVPIPEMELADQPAADIQAWFAKSVEESSEFAQALSDAEAAYASGEETDGFGEKSKNEIISDHLVATFMDKEETQTFLDKFAPMDDSESEDTGMRCRTRQPKSSRDPVLVENDAKRDEPYDPELEDRSEHSADRRDLELLQTSATSTATRRYAFNAGRFPGPPNAIKVIFVLHDDPAATDGLHTWSNRGMARVIQYLNNKYALYNIGFQKYDHIRFNLGVLRNRFKTVTGNGIYTSDDTSEEIMKQLLMYRRPRFASGRRYRRGDNRNYMFIHVARNSLADRQAGCSGWAYMPFQTDLHAHQLWNGGAPVGTTWGRRQAADIDHVLEVDANCNDGSKWVIAHEVGHMFGLYHPFTDNYGNGVNSQNPGDGQYMLCDGNRDIQFLPRHYEGWAIPQQQRYDCRLATLTAFPSTCNAYPNPATGLSPACDAAGPVGPGMSGECVTIEPIGAAPLPPHHDACGRGNVQCGWQDDYLNLMNYYECETDRGSMALANWQAISDAWSVGQVKRFNPGQAQRMHIVLTAMRGGPANTRLNWGYV